VENLINLSSRDELPTMHKLRLVSRIHEEHLEFITEWAVGGNVPGNTEFMATGCFEATEDFMWHIRATNTFWGM
jgi:hypothetical protein